MKNTIKLYLKEALKEASSAIKKGHLDKKIRIGITTLGSEHGENEIVNGAELISRRNNKIEVIVIGNNVNTELKVVHVSSEEEAHKIMDSMLKDGILDGAVTMHYNFPIGISTVGRVITPSRGKKMFIASTTGISSINRIIAMVKNTIAGIGIAKTCGIENPEVGILNIEGAKQVEKVLKQLKKNGYSINFTESIRSDGGSIMRGNDLLLGVPTIMTADSYTGNVLMKIFSAFLSGGNYEALGYGYGPGVGEGFDRIICIISRASGANVVAGAIIYAALCVEGNLTVNIDKEFSKAKIAGLNEIIQELELKVKENKDEEQINEELNEEQINKPPSKPTNSDIPGIEILDLEDAVHVLWKENIYSSSGMGCTGPIIMVADEDLDQARSILKEKGYI